MGKIVLLVLIGRSFPVLAVRVAREEKTVGIVNWPAAAGKRDMKPVKPAYIRKTVLPGWIREVFQGSV